MVSGQFTIQQFEYFLMIFVRLATFIYIAPFFGMRNTPARTKIGFSLVVSVLLYNILPEQNLEYSTVIEYASIIVKEAATGLSIGFVATICTHIVTLAGKIIDMDIGLSMVSLFDPVSNESSSITGTMYNYFIMLLLIVSNMHHYILRALIDSYKLIPVNGMTINYDHLFATAVKFMADYMIIGFRIVLPIFACILVLNVVLGILAKVSPQMNMFAVGIQMKMLLGLIIMFLTITLLPDVANYIFKEMKIMMVSMIESLY